MLTSHELFGFMSPGLATKILEHAHDTNKELYRTALCAVAEARKLRPAYFERTPRAARHAEMVGVLAKPRLEIVSASLVRDWLMKKETQMLVDFLDALKVQHSQGAVDDLPATVDDELLKGAVDGLLGKYPPEEVTLYLNAFYSLNDVRWPNLDAMLKNDARLQFGQ